MIHDVVIYDVTGPGRENRENGSVLELCGLKCGVKRSNRGFLLTTYFIGTHYSRTAPSLIRGRMPHRLSLRIQMLPGLHQLHLNIEGLHLPLQDGPPAPPTALARHSLEDPLRHRQAS